MWAVRKRRSWLEIDRGLTFARIWRVQEKRGRDSDRSVLWFCPCSLLSSCARCCSAAVCCSSVRDLLPLARWQRLVSVRRCSPPLPPLSALPTCPRIACPLLSSPRHAQTHRREHAAALFPAADRSLCRGRRRRPCVRSRQHPPWPGHRMRREAYYRIHTRAPAQWRIPHRSGRRGGHRTIHRQTRGTAQHSSAHRAAHGQTKRGNTKHANGRTHTGRSIGTIVNSASSLAASPRCCSARPLPLCSALLWLCATLRSSTADTTTNSREDTVRQQTHTEA